MRFALTSDLHSALLQVLRRRPAMVIPFTLFNEGPRLGIRVYSLRKIATKSATVSMLVSDSIPLTSKVCPGSLLRLINVSCVHVVPLVPVTCFRTNSV